MKTNATYWAALCAASCMALASCANNNSNQGQQNHASINGNGNQINQTNNYFAAPTMSGHAQRRAGYTGHGQAQQCTPERPCYPQRQPQVMRQPQAYQQGNCLITPGFVTRVDNRTGRVIAVIPDAPTHGGSGHYQPGHNYGQPPQYNQPYRYPPRPY